jgi:hypothetical protein
MTDWAPDPELIEMFRHPERVGPVVARGVDDNWHWEYRASVRDGRFFNWFDIRDIQGIPTAGSGGSAGALPFEDVGLNELGYFGTISWGGPVAGPPRHIGGVVSSDVARVVVELEDGTKRDAVLADISNPAARAFVCVSNAGATRLVALGAGDSQLESKEVRPPDDPQRPPHTPPN